ncbi:MAG: lysophospholipid acyltransferase family protein [Mycobacteriales bacterium]
MSGRRQRAKDRTYRVIVWIGTAFLRLIDVRREVRGVANVPTDGGAVLAITHFSYLDFVLSEWAVFGHNRRYTRFMATAASFKHPVSGPLMRAMGHIPVDRSAGASAYRFAVDALRRGELVGVFPETRVSRSFELLPFKSGAARMAAQSGAPIIPCVVWGSHRIMTRTHKTSLRKSRRTPVTIAFGEPIRVGPDDDPAIVTDKLRQVMQDLLTTVQDDYPDKPAPGAWWVPARRGGGAPTPEQADRLDSALLAELNGKKAQR